MYPIMTTLGVWQRPKCGFLQGTKQFIITSVTTLKCDFPCDIFQFSCYQYSQAAGRWYWQHRDWQYRLMYRCIIYLRSSILLSIFFGMNHIYGIFHILAIYWLNLPPHLEEENIFASVLHLFPPGADFLSIINIFGFCPPPSTAPT